MTSEDAYMLCFWKENRIIEYEPIILTNPCWSYCYALNIIKNRWIEAEPVISNNYYWSYFYAIDIMKERWLEVEIIIKKQKFYWEQYCSYFNIEKEKTNWKIGL